MFGIFGGGEEQQQQRRHALAMRPLHENSNGTSVPKGILRRNKHTYGHSAVEFQGCFLVLRVLSSSSSDDDGAVVVQIL